MTNDDNLAKESRVEVWTPAPKATDLNAFMLENYKPAKYSSLMVRKFQAKRHRLRLCLLDQRIQTCMTESRRSFNENKIYMIVDSFQKTWPDLCLNLQSLVPNWSQLGTKKFDRYISCPPTVGKIDRFGTVCGCTTLCPWCSSRAAEDVYFKVVGLREEFPDQTRHWSWLKWQCHTQVGDDDRIAEDVMCHQTEKVSRLMRNVAPFAAVGSTYMHFEQGVLHTNRYALILGNGKSTKALRSAFEEYSGVFSNKHISSMALIQAVASTLRYNPALFKCTYAEVARMYLLQKKLKHRNFNLYGKLRGRVAVTSRTDDNDNDDS